MAVHDFKEDPEILAYRKAHPFCQFCKYSQIRFLRTSCIKHPERLKCNAKNCNDYNPTCEPIERRSLS